MVFLIFIIAGAVSGTMAGLLGIGGGLLFVPLMTAMLPHFGIPDSIVMHVAVATSLMIIVITSLSSTWAHHRQGQILWQTVLNIIPGVVIGAIAGSLLAYVLPSDILKRVFSLFALIMAIKIFWSWEPGSAHHRLPKRPVLSIYGVIQGTLCALLGMGGGAISVPFFRACNIAMPQAVSMSAALGFPMALTAAIFSMLTGLNEPGMPSWSTGYVYWPAFLGLMPMSVIFAPWGAKLAYRLNTTLLSRIFSAMLLLVALSMWFD
ncbi:MAG: hypothetical protein K0R12_1336 [Gammaproteobacteria bacterium]|jgi:uncharacterized membrane protein YfcA|nr:hypothetical protein [Gammaproteobacteria bacterium]